MSMIDSLFTMAAVHLELGQGVDLVIVVGRHVVEAAGLRLNQLKVLDVCIAVLEVVLVSIHIVRVQATAIKDHKGWSQDGEGHACRSCQGQGSSAMMMTTGNASTRGAL